MYKFVKEYEKPIIPENEFLIIAGPCSVESEEQLMEMANFLLENNVKYMRAGAFKPRTNPHTFQGFGNEGLEILKKVKNKTGIKIVTEIIDRNDIPYYVENVDIIQVGARNMQNFPLLKALGKTNVPILLKRGFGATVEELLYAAEYILAEGNNKLILCERGIKTFETSTRNTLDISSVPVINSITKLPVIIDPSHSAGRSDIVRPLSRAAVAVGSSGLIVEVHNEPEEALSDGEESISFEEFKLLLNDVRKIHSLMSGK
jgi:3-deoxy-7-phosphoheptulonate synthase